MYNGYTNYETWLFCLYYDEEARRIFEEYEFSSRYEFTETLKAEFKPEQLDDQFCDALLTAAYEKIDWYDVVETILAEVDQEARINILAD